MKIRALHRLPATVAVFCLLVACESRQPEKVTEPTPQVFTPETAPDPVSGQPDADTVAARAVNPVPEPAPELPANKPVPLPSVAELKKITPGQEAKRALSNDAMQVFRLQPDAFFKFLESRIPYYRGKGPLKAENDLVRLEITETEMIVETPKGRRIFPLQ